MSTDRRLGARDRRALGIGLAAAVTTVLVRFAVVPAVESVTATRDRLARERRLLAEERALMTASGRIAAEYQAASERLLSIAPRTFGADASGELLVDRVRDVASTSRVYVASIQLLPSADSTIGTLPRSRVEVRGEADFEGLLTFLRGLESGDKLVRVTRLQVEKPGPGREVRGGGPEVLTFGLEAVGLGLPASASVTGTARSAPAASSDPETTR